MRIMAISLTHYRVISPSPPPVNCCLSHHRTILNFTFLTANTATSSPLPKLLINLTKRSMRNRRRASIKFPVCSSTSTEAAPASSIQPNEEETQRKGPDLGTLAKRFWKVAAPYWYSDDKTEARLQLAAVFTLTLATTGISVGFNFLGRDFYNALSNKDQEQFTKQLLYYLAAFAGGIPVSILLPFS